MSDGSSRGADGSPRERLLQAARDVLADDGLEGLTLRAIARRAGVSHGAPLRHFPTLGSLLAAVAADGFRRLYASVETHVDAVDQAAATAGIEIGPRHRLAAAGQGYVRFALDDPGVFSVTFRPERVDVTDPAYTAEGLCAFGQLLDLVAAAQADGWHPDQPTEALAGVVWANVHGLATLILHGALPGVVDDVSRLPGLSTLLVVGEDTTDLLHLSPLTLGSTP
jgi:AcrR family transcriptional regulator